MPIGDYPPPETVAEVPTVECTWCGDFTRDPTTTADRRQPLCQSCADDAATCNDCEEVYSDPWRVEETVTGRTLCTYCASNGDYHNCYRCDRLTTSDRETEGGDTLCRGCAQRYYWLCDGGCGRYTSEGSYCESCAPEEEDESGGGLINDYSYKPYPDFHGDGPVYLGLELEVSAPPGDLYGAASLAVGGLGSVAYLKQDGSLNYGFEIVTHPMSHAWARERFPWHVLEELRRSRCQATDDCGMHVHVSRAAFDSAAHVYRWFKLLYRNAEQVRVIARRESDQWASWGGPHQHRQHKAFAKGWKEPLWGERYSAINVNNARTFEVRIFASSLEATDVQAALDLVAGSVEYTRHLTVAEINRAGGWTWASFLAWAADRPEYSALTSLVRADQEDLACAC